MKKQIIIIVFAFSFSANINAQKQVFDKIVRDTICVKTEVIARTIESKNLIQIAEKFGSDSAFRLLRSGEFTVHRIDTLTALKLLDYVKEYNSRRSTFLKGFLLDMAHYWKNANVGQKIYDFTVIELAKMQAETINEIGRVIEIDDDLLKAIMSQSIDSIDKELIKTYEHYKKLAELYQISYPAEFDSLTNKRTQTFFAFETCHQNCYKIMATLEKIESPFFDSTLLSYHDSKLREGKQKQNKTFRDYRPLYQWYDDFKPKEITLSKNYESLSEINYREEPDFLELTKHSFNGNYFLMFNDDNNEGIIRLYTVMYKIELKDKNKLILKALRSWAFL